MATNIYNTKPADHKMAPLKGTFRAMISNPLDPMGVRDFPLGTCFDVMAGDTLDFDGEEWLITHIEALEEDFEGWDFCILDITCTLNNGVYSE